MARISARRRAYQPRAACCGSPLSAGSSHWKRMMISAATKELNISLASMMFTLVDYTTLGGWPDGTVPDGKAPGADGFVYLCSFGDAYIEYWEFTGAPTWLWVGDDTGWAGEVSISVTSTVSQLARTRDITTHMGSDGNNSLVGVEASRRMEPETDAHRDHVRWGLGITTPENSGHPAHLTVCPKRHLHNHRRTRCHHIGSRTSRSPTSLSV